MTTKTFKRKFIEIDNRLTYIVGYRNLYNIAVLFVSTWFIIVAQEELAPSATPTVFVGAFIMLVMAMKWFLTQVRDNIDASDVYDALDATEE